jgi:hypothetical protein
VLLLGNVLSQTSGCAMMSNNGHINVFAHHCQSSYGAHGQGTDFIHEKMLLGEPSQNFHKQQLTH